MDGASFCDRIFYSKLQCSSKMRARDAKLHNKSSVQMALYISFGLNDIHEENYTHVDMKPHNQLLPSEFNFVLQQQDAS